ncbi:MAG: methyltransferase, partial [Tepidisphaeraceae bacterium]
FGCATLMISEEYPEHGILGPESIGGTSFTIHLHVDNADEVIAHVVEAGATIVRAPQDHFYGERSGTVHDPFGHEWNIGHDISEKPSSAKPEQLGLPPGLALYQMAIGHYLSRALYLAAKLGLADLLKDGSRDFRDLAGATETHAPSLNRVMRLLVSAGLFEELDGDKFTLTPLGELLRSDVPGSMRSVVMLFAGIGIQDSWKELEYCVRTGEPAFRRTNPDGDPFTLMAQDPEQAAIFDKAMATFAPQTAAAVAAAYDFSVFEKVADIGGGNGSLLIGILKANPGLRGMVFDLAHVVERAKDQVTAAGIADRCEVVAGNFFDEAPSGADAYLLKHVIHDWNDERATAILKNCRASMPPSGKLLIVEGVYPARIDQSPESRGATANDVNMLVATGGRQRSEAEFRDLFAASGFRLTRVVPTQARVCVIEGERAYQ